MSDVLGAIVVAFTLLLAAGLITGRVRARSCCTPSDPKRDLRINDQDFNNPS